MKKLILPMLLLSCSSVQALNVTIEKGVYTTHIAQNQMNNDNNLKGVELSLGSCGLNASKFNNSYYNDTTTLGGYYNALDTNYLNIDLMVGITNGYTPQQLPTCISDTKCLYVAPRFTLSLLNVERFNLKLSTTLFGNAVVITSGLSYSF